MYLRNVGALRYHPVYRQHQETNGRRLYSASNALSKIIRKIYVN